MYKPIKRKYNVRGRDEPCIVFEDNRVWFENGDCAYLVYSTLSANSRYFITGTYFMSQSHQFYCIDLDEESETMVLIPVIDAPDVWKQHANVPMSSNTLNIYLN
jgi:hypothetical protein